MTPVAHLTAVAEQGEVVAINTFDGFLNRIQTTWVVQCTLVKRAGCVAALTRVACPGAAGGVPRAKGPPGRQAVKTRRRLPWRVAAQATGCHWRLCGRPCPPYLAATELRRLRLRHMAGCLQLTWHMGLSGACARRRPRVFPRRPEAQASMCLAQLGSALSCAVCGAPTSRLQRQRTSDVPGSRRSTVHLSSPTDTRITYSQVRHNGATPPASLSLLWGGHHTTESGSLGLRDPSELNPTDLL